MIEGLYETRLEYMTAISRLLRCEIRTELAFEKMAFRKLSIFPRSFTRSRTVEANFSCGRTEKAKILWLLTCSMLMQKSNSIQQIA